MLENFILYSLLAGIGIAVVTAMLGCFVIWRRMAYFGDSLSHSALLGISLGVIYNINTNIGILIVCTIFALVLVKLQKTKIFATDTLLGILAHASLAFGILTLSYVQNLNLDLHGFLFGDIITVTQEDLLWIYISGFFVLFLLLKNWSPLLLMTINEDLAKAEGVNIEKYQYLLLFLMTLVVAISIHLVGILLITSLLIIPAATARQFSHSPNQMALFASFFGVLSVCGGITMSFWLDTPSGPSIVSFAALSFILLLPFSFYLRKKEK